MSPWNLSHWILQDGMCSSNEDIEPQSSGSASLGKAGISSGYPDFNGGPPACKEYICQTIQVCKYFCIKLMQRYEHRCQQILPGYMRTHCWLLC